jgi:5-formyltetrahydrofolate cyclo-ligase
MDMKQDLRQKMLTKRLELTTTQQENSLKIILMHLKNHPLYKRARHIGLYYPIKNEVSILSLLSDQEKTFYLPKVAGQTLIYVQYHANTSLVRSSLNILEPVGNLDDASLLDLVLIPALAIDKNNHRLGFGKGYFDRFLADHPHLKVIAIIYQFQKVEVIEHEPHDMPVDDVISD